MVEIVLANVTGITKEASMLNLAVTSLNASPPLALRSARAHLSPQQRQTRLDPTRDRNGAKRQTTLGVHLLLVQCLRRASR